MQWLDNNKQWIFDGAGVVVVVAIFGFIFNLIRGTKKNSESTSSPQKTEISNTNTNQIIVQLHAEEIQPKRALVSTATTKSQGEANEIKSTESPVKLTKITKLTPTEIRRAIKNVPLLMQESLAKQYHGLTVEWTTELRDAEPITSGGLKDKNSVDLFLKIIEDNADQIFHEFASCVVSLDDYQELKIASAGVKIKVIGEIERISGTFSLKNVKLYFESDL